MLKFRLILQNIWYERETTYDILFSKKKKKTCEYKLYM